MSFIPHSYTNNNKNSTQYIDFTRTESLYLKIHMNFNTTDLGITFKE